MILNLCENSGSLRIFYLINWGIKIIFVLVPIVLILKISFDLIKYLINNNEKDDKTFVYNSIKRIILGITIFFIPTIVNIFVGLLNIDYLEKISDCIDKTSIFNMKYITIIENIENDIEMLKNKPTYDNLETAQKSLESLIEISESDSLTDKELIENFEYELGISSAKIDDLVNELNESIKNAKTQADINNAEVKCNSQGGIIENNVCTFPKAVTDSSSENTTLCGDTSNMASYSFKSSNDYYVINNPSLSVESYEKIISSKQIKQKTSSKTYNDMCLSIAYTHAYDLYKGIKNDTLKGALKYQYAGKFKAYDSDNKSDVLKRVCEELVNNKTVILQVNGNKSGTSRHYVTVIGFKKSAASGGLSEGDLLIIDSYDGKVEGLKPTGSRFMVTGSACHKDYSGYQIYYLK